MGDLLTIELVLATLLVTSFTSFGLLALWAAASPRHWFVRTMAFLTVLSPLLFIPAYEPFVAFVLQAATVAGGAYVYRRWYSHRRQRALAASTDASKSTAGVRFSLSTLLLLTAMVAVSTLIMMELPSLNTRGWMSVVVIGISTGWVTLVAAWMWASNRKLLVWPIGLVFCFVAGLAVSQIEWFAHGVVKHEFWPPNPPATSGAKILGTPPEPLPVVWPLSLPSLGVMLVLFLLVYRFTRENKRSVAWIGLSLLVVLVAAFPLGVLWTLLHPQPIFDQQLPQPNGYDEFVAAGKAFNSSPILNTTVQPMSTAQLAAEVAKFTPTFDQVRYALTLPCEVPLAPIEPDSPSDFAFESVQSIRSVARALNCKAELAQQHRRFSEAALISIENVRVGEATARGGLVPHYLVGIAAEGIGMAALHQAARHLDTATCRAVIDALETIDENREPLEATIERDRVYCMNAWGWYGHLMLIMDDITNDHPGYQATQIATRRSAAIRRLLMMELALRQYRLEKGEFPDRLAALTPKYASRVPTDPFDAQHRTLRYVPRAKEYLLYSVGFDGDDDGGRPSSRDSGWFDDGDMRLDAYFLPAEDGAGRPNADDTNADTGDND